MDLEKFGEIMDDFLKDNHVQMLIDMPEGTLDPVVKDNVNAGPVVKLYFLLNAISAVCKDLKSCIDINEKENPEDWEKTVDAILNLVKAELMEG